MFPSCPSFTCAIKMLASGSQLCFLASPISILQSNSSGTGNLFTSHSFNCLIICSSVMIKSSNVLLSPQPSPAWKKSIQSVLLRCGLFCCYSVNPNYSFSSEVFCEMIREVHGPFQSHVGSVSSQWSSVLFLGSILVWHCVWLCDCSLWKCKDARSLKMEESSLHLFKWCQCTRVPCGRTSSFSCCCVANLPCLHPFNSGHCMQA